MVLPAPQPIQKLFAAPAVDFHAFRFVKLAFWVISARTTQKVLPTFKVCRLYDGVFFVFYQMFISSIDEAGMLVRVGDETYGDG